MPSRRRTRSADQQAVVDEKQQRFAKLQNFLAETRSTWLSARSDADVLVVAARLRTAIRTMKEVLQSPRVVREEDVQLLECCLSRARNHLGLLYMQQRNLDGARHVLSRLGALARLSSHILRYDPRAQVDGEPSHLCYYVDDVLPPHIMRVFRNVFGPIDAAYWKDHNYSVEPPSPYFSYVLNVADIKKNNNAEVPLINVDVEAIRRAAQMQYEQLADAKFVEVWSHNRSGYQHGHQLHYDSDDEGKCGIRNPLATVVFFVSAPEKETGGPTLVIDQRMSDARLGSTGALCFPAENRCVFFESNLLHGVIPGRHPQDATTSRRVTLMFAFWKDIQVRRETTPGSARPFPSSAGPAWAKQLLAPISAQQHQQRPLTKANDLKTPPKLSHVFERVSDDKPWPKKTPIPPYESVFQGF